MCECRQIERLFSLHIRGHSTSIDGTIHSRGNEATWPLQNANLVLMIKLDANHSDVHHLKLNLTQSSFPIRFMLRNVDEIKHTDDYLLSLLIFAYPHRLLWEGVLFRQHLIVETTNSINFTVQDVCKKSFLFLFFLSV